jgi:hypothetical protein
MTDEVVLVVHAAATWAMVGLIWFVQLVHYPLFAAVGTEQFAGYEARHTRRTTWVVAVFMPIELLTAAWLALDTPAGIAPLLAWTGAVLALLLWVVTLLVQVPQHGRLSDGFEPSTWRALVLGNWVRTATWSARGVIAAAMLVAA